MRSLIHFIIHLRLHYQFFILSGGYLLSFLYVENPDLEQYILQFLNVHILLFGGATAYNSYWDKDKGPIGGLKNPPPMKAWMNPASIAMQIAGLVWAWFIGFNFAVIYAISMFFFWAYSHPSLRLKGKPVLSLVAIGVSTGTNSFFLGYLAAGGYPITWWEDLAAFGVAFVLLSLYPVSQVFQMEEDKARGDKTFAEQFGLRGVKRLFSVLFPAGVACISLSLNHHTEYFGYIFGALGLLSYSGLLSIVWSLKGRPEEYFSVMRIKLVASLGFVVFILVASAYRLMAP